MAIWNDSDHCKEHDVPWHQCVLCREKEIHNLRLKVLALEEELSICIDIIEESGVDYEEILASYKGE